MIYSIPSRHTGQCESTNSRPMRGGVFLLLLVFFRLSVGVQAQHRRFLTQSYYRAVALQENGRADTAARLFDSLFRAKPHAFYAFAATHAYLCAGQGDSARERLSSKRFGKSLEQLLLRARLECYYGEPARGVASLRQYLRSRQKLPELAIQNDTLLRPCHDLPVWDSLWIGTKFTRDQRNIGELDYHARQGDWGIVEDILEGMSPRQQGRAKYAFYRAQLLRAEGEMRSALNASEYAYKRYPKRAEYAFLYALLLNANAKPKKALRVLGKYSLRDPNNPRLLALSAQSYYQLKRYAEAYSAAKDYLSYYPKDTVGLRLYSLSAYHERRYAQTLRGITQLLPFASSSQSVELYCLRAQTLLAIGEARQSLPDLEQARRIAPQDTTVLMQLGRVFLLLNRRGDACSCFARADNLGCPYAWGWRARAMLGRE